MSGITDSTKKVIERFLSETGHEISRYSCREQYEYAAYWKKFSSNENSKNKVELFSSH